jgi:glycosyltransferase involved in cell wall biosynthesis
VFLLKSIAKVLREVPGAVLVVVGREENVRASHLHSVASGLGITKSVEFLGHVPDPFEIMRLCHVGMISSIGSEAISRVALEWMSVGRPIVATRVGCLPEVVLDQQTGFLVNPKDPDAMAQRLIELLRNADLRRRMGLRARERFANHFTLPQCIEKTERFYEEILHAVSPR